MATIKLGSFITNIAGSVGGSTFRRFRSSIVLYNKPKGASKNKTLLNQALPRLGTVIQNWSLLTDSERALWKAKVNDFTFYDKFGDVTTLTGRLFYIKNMAILSNVGIYSLDISNISAYVEPLYISSWTASLGQGFNIQLAEIVDSTYCLVQLELMSSPNVAPTFTRRKILQTEGTPVPVSFEISQFVRENFRLMVPGDYLRVYLTPVKLVWF